MSIKSESHGKIHAENMKKKIEFALTVPIINQDSARYKMIQFMHMKCADISIKL